MLGREFLVDLQVEIALQFSDRKQKAGLRTNTDDTRLEIAECRAGSAVAGELLIIIADQPQMHLLGHEAREPPIQVRVDAVLILQVGLMKL